MDLWSARRKCGRDVGSNVQQEVRPHKLKLIVPDPPLGLSSPASHQRGGGRSNNGTSNEAIFLERCRYLESAGHGKNI